MPYCWYIVCTREGMHGTAGVIGDVITGERDLALVRARELARGGRPAEALKIYRQLLDADPDDTGVLMGLGDLSIGCGDAATAAKFYRRVVTLEPRNEDAVRALEAADRKFAGVVRPSPLWETDISYRAILATIPFTLVDPVRCYMLYQFAAQAERMKGDVAEIGVYRGGTARLIASVVQGSGRPVHLFDTFEGMPPTDPGRDEHRKGDFSDTSLEAVRQSLEGLPAVRFYPGIFPATAGPVSGARFCMVHVDVDIYRSVLDCCRFFYPRMVPGGIMVFDDYGFDTCPGARAAVDEYFRDRPERPWYVPSGQCVVIRR